MAKSKEIPTEEWVQRLQNSHVYKQGEWFSLGDVTKLFFNYSGAGNPRSREGTAYRVLRAMSDWGLLDQKLTSKGTRTYVKYRRARGDVDWRKHNWGRTCSNAFLVHHVPDRLGVVL